MPRTTHHHILTPLRTLDNDTVTELADAGGIIAPTGPAGSVMMFHGKLVHASPPNITPLHREFDPAAPSSSITLSSP